MHVEHAHVAREHAPCCRALRWRWPWPRSQPPRRTAHPPLPGSASSCSQRSSSSSSRRAASRLRRCALSSRRSPPRSAARSRRCAATRAASRSVRYRRSSRPGSGWPRSPPRTSRCLPRSMRSRLAVSAAARHWPVERPDVHEALYRVLYGGRAAIEEALAQQRAAALPALTVLAPVASAAPSTLIEDVRVHSGDIVLSRGDAPTSALIARGNPFPGNFSHVAIVHVEPESGKTTVIEALIERGVVTRSAEDFLPGEAPSTAPVAAAARASGATGRSAHGASRRQRHPPARPGGARALRLRHGLDR